MMCKVSLNGQQGQYKNCPGPRLGPRVYSKSMVRRDQRSDFVEQSKELPKTFHLRSMKHLVKRNLQNTIKF